MNKTINININGSAFHIEEDAYEILKAYMTEVTRHFMNSADSLEITTDIENRIAEMFTEILSREAKQVIVAQDVNYVLQQMGSVSEFEAEAEGERPGSFNFAPTNRRLFRNPDEHLVGGVAAGIANYFDVDAIWVRLAFVLFTAAGGMGFLLYCVLWIVVPKAVTRADRMAMKGQPLDLQGFKANFEQEIGTLKGNIHTLTHDAKPLAYKTRDFAGDVFGHFGSFVRVVAKLLFKLVGIAIILGCFAGIVALLVGIILYIGYDNPGMRHVFPFNIVEHDVNTIFIVAAFLMGALPLLAIMLVAINAIFKRSSIGRTTGSALLMIWVVALSVVIYYTTKAAANFREGATVSQTVNIKASTDSTYYIKLNDIKFISSEDSARYNIKGNADGRVILDDDRDNDMDMPDKNIELFIEKADVAQPTLVERFSARGADFQDALDNAKGISYHFIQEGNVLKFNRRFDKRERDYWRSQEVRLTLRVPRNAKLIIDANVDRFLRNGNIWDCNDINKKDNQSPAKFIMTDNGLECKVDTVVTPKPAKPLLPADSVKMDSLAVTEE